MSDIDAKPFPRLPLIGAGLLVGMTILFAAGPRLGLAPPAVTATAARTAAKVAPLEVRDLRFIDRPDGSLLIEDAGRGTVAAVLPAGGNNGFIRGVVRGMARERLLREIGDAPPFRLTLFRDGALTLYDPSTARNIELGSFGPTNKQSFADLLLLHRPVPSAEALRGRVQL